MQGVGFSELRCHYFIGSSCPFAYVNKLACIAFTLIVFSSIIITFFQSEQTFKKKGMIALLPGGIEHHPGRLPICATFFFCCLRPGGY
jgi:hypothetical protein